MKKLFLIISFIFSVSHSVFAMDLIQTTAQRTINVAPSVLPGLALGIAGSLSTDLIKYPTCFSKTKAKLGSFACGTTLTVGGLTVASALYKSDSIEQGFLKAMVCAGGAWFATNLYQKYKKEKVQKNVVQFLSNRDGDNTLVEVFPLTIDMRSQDGIQTIIDHGFDIDFQQGGEPLLRWAINKNNFDIIQRFKERYSEALEIAVKQENNQVLDFLINQEKVNVNSKAQGGCTPLAEAIKVKNHNIIEKLIQAGACVCFEELQEAVKSKDCEILEKIAQKVTGINSDSDEVKTLFGRVINHNYELNIIKILLEYKLVNVDGMTLYGYPSEWAIVEVENLEIVKLLIEHGAKVNVERGGKRLLTLAIEKNNIDIVKALLKAGVNAKIHNVLMKPILDGNIKLVKLLAGNGATIELDDEDDTPLRWITSEHELEKVELFLEYGKVDPNRGARFGGDYPLLWAIEVEDLEMVNLLIKYNANVNDQTCVKQPLIYAIEKNNIDIVKTLIKAGADVNLAEYRYLQFSERSKWETLPLSEAIVKKDQEVIKVLIEAGANINLQSPNEETPLMLACKYYPQLVKMLITTENKQGKDALDCARGDEEATMQMLSAFEYIINNIERYDDLDLETIEEYLSKLVADR